MAGPLALVPPTMVSNQRKAIRQRERQLADRVGASFGNVVAADGHAVEVSHVVVHKILRNIAHDLERKLGREDAGVLALVFLQDVGLHRAAHIGQHPFANFGSLGFGVDSVDLILWNSYKTLN